MKNMQFVVLFFFCLSASTLCWPEVEPESAQALYPGPTYNLSYDGLSVLELPFHTDWKEIKENFGFFCEEPGELDLNQLIAESSYTDILTSLSNKILLDFKSVVSVALDTFLVFWALCKGSIQAYAFRAFKAWLEVIITLWISVISAILSGLTWALLNIFPHTLTLIFLFFFTNLLVKGFRILCGTACLAFLRMLFSPLLPVKRILTWTLARLLGNSFGRKLEKATEGWKSFEIKMAPPSSSALPVRNRITKEHAGYCGFVQTHMKNADGTYVEAFITARHVIDDDLGEIHSPKTKNFIACADLEVLGDWESIDLILLRAPKHARSYLGCKPASMVAIDRLATCDASTFHLIDGEWHMSNARLVGDVKNGVAVLSNSVCGHSGSPFYNGKHILGVLYGGGSYFENFNVMNPIPAIPGLTTPERRLETTAPRGKIFNNEDFFQKLEEEYLQMKNFKSKTGVDWADLPSDDEMDFQDALPSFRKAEKAEPSHPVANTREPAVVVGDIRCNISGNAESRVDCYNNAPTFDAAKSLEKVVDQMVANVDTLAIQHEAAQILAARLFDNQKKMKAEQYRRGSRGAPKPTISEGTSKTNTTGKYVPLHRKSPGSVTAEPYRDTTSPARRERQNGARRSPGTIPHWVRRQPATAGRNSAQGPN
ncbi:P1 [Suakwa aphid-borne yellows virus]|uniref:P1 n=1 Tax=Suakwa aphid-borne yellows virus TaxID=646010 RepID=J7FDP3_9VIRU|nr:P1 [Suakwa aphid-borne yellows virus]AFM68943.1 P1 [Suakwa aphid-borne yellows virus]